MILNLGMWPITLMILAFIIPLAYCIIWKKTELKKISVLTASAFIIIILYPLTFYLPGVIGYAIAKGILFIIIPTITIFYLEKWKIQDILTRVGVNKDNLGKSIIFGFLAAIVTIAITAIISKTHNPDVLWRIIMFLEAFTEEFFFRGILFLYLLKITNIKVAYVTSIFAFVLAHPQHFTNLFIISTTVQAILLTIVTHKTKNITGPWIAHGLNRNIPSLIRIALGL